MFQNDDLEVLKDLNILLLRDAQSRNNPLIDNLIETIAESARVEELDFPENSMEFSVADVDIIISDMNMQKTYAQEAIERIREKTIQVPIIMMVTMHCINECLNKISFGGIQYIYKPISSIDQTIEALLLAAKNAQNFRILEDKLNLLNQYKNAVDLTSIVSKSDLKGVITYVNDKFCKISGYEVEELIGKPHNIIRHPDTPREVFKDLWETIENKRIWSGKIKNLTKNGDVYIVDSTIIPITDSRGNISEYISIRHDITELQNALEKANAAKKAKEEFLANMSHEIRTPLNAILGFVDILKEQVTDPEKREYVETIDKSGKILLNTLNDILDFAKIESRKIDIEQVSFDTKAEIRHILSLFIPKADEKEIKIICNTAENLPPYIISDVFRIKQVLSNLLSNAIKFTSKGKSIYLNIEYASIEKKLIFKVKDEGIGIPKDAQTKIFNPFEQSDGSVTREYGGTGLGLAISKNLAVILGGDITLQSEPGKGSEFTFYLPVQVGEPPNKTEHELQTHPDELPHLKILAAEDNDANRAYLKVVLTKNGIDVDFAKDGEEALKLFFENSYDCVLMDENMPKLNGKEAVKQILDFERANALEHTPIIALSALSLKGDREKFLEAGMDDYVSKPIEKRLLFKAIYNSVKNRSLQQKSSNPQPEVESEKYSFKSLAKLLEMDIEDARMIIGVFKASTSDSLRLLQEAIFKNDLTQINKSAHKIAGSMGYMMGLEEINTLAKECERRSSHGEQIDYQAYYDRIKKLLEKLP